jgi:hypothetical protein
MSTENAASPVCLTCGDLGWIVVNQTWEWPYGEQKQCPDCTSAPPPSPSSAGCVMNAARLSVGALAAVSSVCLVPGSRVSYTTQTGEPQEAS